MELYKLKAHELKDMISKKEVKVEEVTNSFLNRIEEVDEKVNALLYVAKEEAVNTAKELDKKIESGESLSGLSGVPVAIKDNISVKNMQNTCASKILEGYVSPYDATVIENLKKNNGVIIGKANMDEFAMGSSTENSAFKVSKNPWSLERVPGGSSGGSAVAVASLEAPISLGTETGGSVRQPASFCGLVGLKPTYGRISRYGVVAFGSTLDQVGMFARDVEDCALLTQNIAGLDKMDFTTVDTPVQDYSKSLNKDLKGRKIGIPKEFFEEGLDEGVREAVKEAIKVFEENGAEVKECSLPLSDYALAAYYIISSAEASSNLARFDGVRYGYRDAEAENALDLYVKSRSKGFGEEAKRRIMLGTYVLSKGYYDAYYKKALKVRSLIKNDFQRAFKEFDAIITPTTPTPAFRIGEKTKDVLSMYMSDIYTVPVNIAGIPSISVPCGFVSGLPVGLQIMGNYFKEDTLFNLAYSYEQSTKWHDKIANL
ncbi:aspartyl-tRNA(Asn)/glutamyl-tRNA(Gln) amidotransferase subunit A [Clostridium acetobutylicum]|uniref:Glutamyl-tRNA(Gln) amidotransferase subunit A 1 n=1 Tax=Clostridium acetobutylicum (strain ATCC 824 / DSM 792 / JCM 1419 / IAM 19013 / LMG 5710 / NBRC 13948 / NRRL B-527 / VKM B-1787 / 2291 / W) TaxID=272562 RepID=GATA1_CLOAB|nr:MULTISPECIES: Asp-tRNA(Asn)/Glu-tRNA(Gln) amidotransferase subunit GatA [Clostridium]Q97FQ7.1 RecName: Full=Glutamyl-tRNA(Gln) amidotransferase subunit A 1; Short=Glu-ADT subunit A 1 [Clostridium acetobutylicum ATCC 824]AAK80617.1 Glu-tRNAGln amidotransferase subunit A [Clostridium acetobutylicum ATCC 824]ADZ21716.1 Glu-tRNAGln amidotransferase subunit A [Clostridium acetobutylicum EA 2018]AEI33698.1 aspartyl/glutamyl-tRNA amidotransferase subunit A [Clostridium acetobutylicum DSM 1731]AWV7